METLKICVPVSGGNIDEIKKEAEFAFAAGADIIEFRGDCYENIQTEAVAALAAIKETAAVPVIFTLREIGEGGKTYIPQDIRLNIMREAIKSPFADYIDIERANGREFILPLLTEARQNGVKTIISSHDFKCTPLTAEIVNILTESAELGADMVKIAVTPNSMEDVLTLLKASLEYKNTTNSRPLIAISMGEMGKISRIAALIFGSCITFASVTAQTAPGQIPIGELKQALAVINPRRRWQ